MEPDDIPEKVQRLYDKAIKAILDRIDELSLTQEQVALRCGLEQGTISRYLSGSRGENLHFKTILTLAHGLQIDLPILLETYETPQEELKALLERINKLVVNQ